MRHNTDTVNAAQHVSKLFGDAVAYVIERCRIAQVGKWQHRHGARVAAVGNSED